MRIQVYLDVTIQWEIMRDEKWTRGYRTHVITLSNVDALKRLEEYIKDQALDNAGLTVDDCLVYDDELDG